MSTPRSEPLPTANGVASGAKCTFDLELGWLYRRLTLLVSCAAGNKTFDEIISDIWLTVNGKPQRTHSALELNEINGLHDQDLTVKTVGSIAGGDYAAYLPICLAETYRKNVENGLGLGWNAVGINALQLQVQFRTVTGPSISGVMIREPGVAGRGLGPITKWKRQYIPATGTPQDYSKIFALTTVDNFLQSIHLWPIGARYITRAELKFNGSLYHDRTNLHNQAELLFNGMNPDLRAAPRYDLVVDESDAVGDPPNLRNANGHNLKLTFDGAPAGNSTVITQETGLPE